MDFQLKVVLRNLVLFLIRGFNKTTTLRTIVIILNVCSQSLYYLGSQRKYLVLFIGSLPPKVSFVGRIVVSQSFLQNMVKRRREGLIFIGTLSRWRIRGLPTETTLPPLSTYSTMNLTFILGLSTIGRRNQSLRTIILLTPNLLSEI